MEAVKDGYAGLLSVDPQTGRTIGLELLLVPSALATGLNAARRALYDRRGNPRAWERACVMRVTPTACEDDDCTVEPAPSPAPSPAQLPAVPQHSPAPKPAISRRKRRSPGEHQVHVISAEDLFRRSAEIELKYKFSTTERKLEEKFVGELLARGEDRPVGLKKDWHALLSQLRSDMPTFSAVVDRIEACCALARFTRTPLRIPPLLLAGPPGVGKTHFATRLAGVLGVAQFVYSLESAETVSVLCGSEKHWGNTESGELWKLVVQGAHANPVVVLDELDKTNQGSSYRPANALHAVLEPVTSRQLRDKSIDMAFNASYVVYIATANRLSTIDASLLSRFEPFFIDEPGPRAAVSIARAIARQLLAELRLGRRFAMPGGEVVQQLALLGGPRQMQKALKVALGRAVSAGRTTVLVQDLLDGRAMPADTKGSDERVH